MDGKDAVGACGSHVHGSLGETREGREKECLVINAVQMTRTSSQYSYCVIVRDMEEPIESPLSSYLGFPPTSGMHAD